MSNEQLAISKRKRLFLNFALCSLLPALLFCVTPVLAQDRAAAFEDMWVCPVFESGLYGISHISLGSGAALGYGERMAFGLKVVYWNDVKEVSALELNFLARFYFFRMAGAVAPWNSGLFVQFSGGPVIFARGEDSITMPSDTVMLSAGLSLGWRFPLGRYFFIEPAFRGGYPYFVTAGLSAGVHF
jgi:hypothetical protein